MPESRQVSCRNCGRTVRIPHPAEGHPYGWYHLSVTVPPWFNAETGRPYRWIGLFCTAACLAAGIPAIEKDEAIHRLAYEPE